MSDKVEISVLQLWLNSHKNKTKNLEEGFLLRRVSAEKGGGQDC